MSIANATDCSSIYGGDLPTTPYTTNADGRGPSWSNSLFKDNAEFGLGMRLAGGKQTARSKELVALLASRLGESLADGVLNADQPTETGIFEQRERVATLKDKFQGIDAPEARTLAAICDQLDKRSVWILGGYVWRIHRRCANVRISWIAARHIGAVVGIFLPFAG